ncbi:uncharacterized protein C16orf86 homolog [Haliaeetus albicilla]|uniref:uncharacterized protein C16orf86 homolog n=1 Tax=Haliaeetus albicilla TaxID=8969 RepID=UPI0037E8BE68
MGKNKAVFPELVDLGCVAALQAWLLAYGFKLKGTKVNSQVLRLQHPDFQRAYPTTKEPGTLRGDIGLSAKQERKRKKKRHASSLHSPRGAKSQDTLGQLPRLRPLYQYINLDMTELMHPSPEDEVPELAQPSQVPAASSRATAPQLEDTCASSAPEIPAPEAGDKSMQVDIDRMLRYAAHLVPLLFPQSCTLGSSARYKYTDKGTKEGSQFKEDSFKTDPKLARNKPELFCLNEGSGFQDGFSLTKSKHKPTAA